ncbi:MAG: thioesterase family protein [Polyangiales bacterium]
MDDAAFFSQLDEDLFEATQWTRGPWSPIHQHGGPPAALLCGRLEEKAGDGFRVVRVDIEFPRPVPIGRLRVEMSVRRSGRSVTAIVGQLFDMEGTLVMTAEALALARVELRIPAARPALDEPLPSDSRLIEFPLQDSKPGYAAGVELRMARGAFGDGDVMAWMRMRLPLIGETDPSPLERTLIAADSGNGVSQRVSASEFTFLNADLTVTLHHQAEGEWIGMAARTDFDLDGAGVADTRLYDECGPIGRGIQTLLIRKR